LEIVKAAISQNEPPPLPGLYSATYGLTRIVTNIQKHQDDQKEQSSNLIGQAALGCFTACNAA